MRNELTLRVLHPISNVAANPRSGSESSDVVVGDLVARLAALSRVPQQHLVMARAEQSFLILEAEPLFSTLFITASVVVIDPTRSLATCGLQGWAMGQFRGGDE